MAKWIFADKEEIMNSVRMSALDTIGTIMNEWDGASDETKVAAINGVLTMFVGLDEQISLEDQNDTMG